MTPQGKEPDQQEPRRRDPTGENPETRAGKQRAESAEPSPRPRPKAQPVPQPNNRKSAQKGGAERARRKGTAGGADAELIRKLGAVRRGLTEEIQKVIVGQERVIELMLIALFCRAHVLMVGVPGLAKTLLVRTIADTMDLDFKRIQFTPDLMPSDITGTEILEIDPETQQRRFRFQRGPIFTNILLADEINRTPPKTQAALLECMQEYRLTAAGTTYELERPFFVLATQNPIEQEGTYPLPEAQLDRFMFMIWVDYPERDEEIEIMKRTTQLEMPEAGQVMEGADILKVQEIVRRVPISEHVLEYVTDIARATRPDKDYSPQFIKDWLSWGAGPRAAQYMVLGAKAHAVINGRFNVSCADVRAVAHPVLRHRILTNFNADSEGIAEVDIIDRLLENIPEPDESAYAEKAARERASGKKAPSAPPKG